MKIKIGGILEVQHLTLIKMLGILNHPGYAGTLLTLLGEENINLFFVAESEDIHGQGNITICVSKQDTERARILVNTHHQQHPAVKISAVPEVTSLSIYGPHFRETPNICGQMCAALGDRNINILGISTSISSICCLIPNTDYAAAKAALLDRFELP
ncbi:MAG: hypothetical protein GXO90_05285 [FCB group bacterium]|nr:hypothetical protein [FCB group bacterium]